MNAPSADGKESFEAPVALLGGVVMVSVFALVIYLAFSAYCKGESNDGNSSFSLFKDNNARKHGFIADTYQKFKLIKKINVSHNTRIFRFALQDDDTIMGLPCGRHLSFRFFENDPDTHELDEIRRNYTPITSNRDVGHFDVMIKVYKDGKMSSYLDALKPNDDFIEACGPCGEIEYTSPGKVAIKERRYTVTKIGLIAGGTGITPMLQLMEQIIFNKDPIQVSLIFGNVSIDDILLHKELEAIRKKHDNIHIRLVIDKAPTDGREWDEDVGYVTEDLMKTRLFPPAEDVVTFLCGPPGLRRACTQGLLKLGHDEDRVITF
eukprot:42913_1